MRQPPAYILALLATPILLKGVTMADQKDQRDLLAEAEKLLSRRTNAATRDRIRLRDAVCAYFDAERARGVPAEVVEATVAQILLHAEGRAGNSGDGNRVLAQQLIEWCLSLDQPPGPNVKLENLN